MSDADTRTADTVDEDAVRGALEAAYRRKGDEGVNRFELYAYASELPGGTPDEVGMSIAADVVADPPDLSQNSEKGSSDLKNHELGDGDIAECSGERFHPAALQARDWWVTWILDGKGRKRPVAPWQNGHAYPAEWSEGLTEDERPETDYDTARRWAEFSLDEMGLELPEDAQSDDLGLGIILPADRPDDLEDRIALIDWDDVRDAETGAIHPVAADYIDRIGGYVEVSTSGEGLHQFVTGGLRHRGKFIAPIGDEPFIGDDLPQVEIYDGGRHVAMTGRHVEGTGDDVVPGQDAIDAIVTEYADAETDAGHRRYDPETGEVEARPDDEAGSSVPEPKTGEYQGPSLQALRERTPTGRSLDYHAAVEAFYRGGGNAHGYAHVQNWRLEGFVAALGERDDLDERTVKEDLSGGYLGESDVKRGCIHRTPERIHYGYQRAKKGRLNPPTCETLVDYGIMPPAILDESRSGDGDVSDYYSYGLRAVAEENGYANPYEDDTALLRACLVLREQYGDLADATPPYAALVALAEHVELPFDDADDRILGETAYNVARRMFDDFTADDLG